MDKMLIYQEFGKIIRLKRKKLRLTQEALASRLEISRASLANIESGNQRVLLHQFLSIAEGLGLDPKDILPSRAIEKSSISDVNAFNWSKTELSENQQRQLIDLIQNDMEQDGESEGRGE